MPWSGDRSKLAYYKKLEKHKRKRVSRIHRGMVTAYQNNGPGGAIVADRQRCKLKYVGQKLFSATGLPQYYSFRGNDIFDTDVALGGNQPSGYDQWAGFYNKYRVLACKADFTVNQFASTNGNVCQLVLLPTTDYTGTVLQTIITNSQQPYAITKYTNVNQGAGAIIRMRSYKSSAKMFGVTKDTVQNDDPYAALINADPAETWEWVIGQVPMDGASTMSAFMSFTITYYVEFFDRKPLGAS